ncbi:putative alpha-L-fucosidase [Medicago truncatula]|uniref:Putative alpha-L-fucosidase n=1 Tax=Medicago truncatula TaxID=3880 RepID=A0A396GBK7_MEDTR|nr:putative alpha-L-fucosidase [Medicago truncatula]
MLYIGTEPRTKDFSKAIYTIDIAQNDIGFGLQKSSEEQVRRSIPDILSQFSQAVQPIKPTLGSITDSQRTGKSVFDSQYRSYWMLTL